MNAPATPSQREKWAQRALFVLALPAVIGAALLVGWLAETLFAWAGADYGLARWLGGFFTAVVVTSVKINTKVRWR